MPHVQENCEVDTASIRHPALTSMMWQVSALKVKSPKRHFAVLFIWFSVRIHLKVLQ
jgi:hypothetical protein